MIIGLVVLIPLIYPLALPIRPGKDSKEVYDFVEGLADSSKVLLSCEYGPSTKPEIHPMVTSLLHHLFSLDRDIRFMLFASGQMVSLWQKRHLKRLLKKDLA